MRRMIWPLIFGLAGAAVLAGLGLWQLQRLDWKEAVLADIEARIAAAPVALPDRPEPGRDRYLPVRLAGRFTADELQVLTSRKHVGPGYRIIAAFVTGDGRRVMVDRGFAPEGAAAAPAEGPAEITGNLHWPDETDAFTPAPDIETGLWFARDVASMAEALGSEPVLVVARAVAPPDPAVTPWPVDSAGIPNDHLQYAITWFSLAAVWLGMTGLWLWRIRRRNG